MKLCWNESRGHHADTRAVRSDDQARKESDMKAKSAGHLPRRRLMHFARRMRMAPVMAA